MNTISAILGDYAKNVQPQTLSRRPNDGAAPSPDIARLKGARLVTTSEPEKGLELNAALIKQLTGGDTYTGRFLNENPVEFRPEFAIFFNTNHLPICADSTIFESGRVRIIPFDRHFSEAEQDKGLKRSLLSAKNRSGILNWLIDGYRMLQAEGLTAPECVTSAIAEYRQEADVIGEFLAVCTVPAANHRQQTSELYGVYLEWAKSTGFKALDNRGFVGELRRRCEVKRDCAKGNVVIGVAVK
jgi:putative DNA primase/helicase